MTRHVIMVPGFVGFDVIGDLRYYAGVTALFRAHQPQPGVRGVLHYFDNFPTASVAQRAERLRIFMAKRWARGELAAGDEVTLVGHSTGGLDIRKLLVDLRVGVLDPLTNQRRKQESADGTAVKFSDLRGLVKRVVFLSVPHFGTNIADFFHELRGPLKAAARSARTALDANELIPAPIQALVGAGKAQLFHAVADALRDTDVRAAWPHNAYERESKALLSLWLEHIEEDDGALADLRSDVGVPTPSPAHFDAAERAAELADFGSAQQPIAIQSYATRVAKAPDSGSVSKVLTALGLWARPLSRVGSQALEVFRRVPLSAAVSTPAAWGLESLFKLVYANAGPDLFALLHGICASNRLPFRTSAALAAGGNHLSSGAPFSTLNNLRADDNDGIVNTQSMLWPPAVPGLTVSHVLVEADHGDIIGHHTQVPVLQKKQGGREWSSYDLFESESGFGAQEFAAVWNRVLQFAV
jgi:triacylglycerol lipase